MLKIINARIVTDGKIYIGKNLYINEGKIFALSSEELPYDKCIDAKKNYVSAGFIDIHVHGGGGFDYADGGCEPIVKAARFHMSHGVTTTLPTLPAADAELIDNFLSDVKRAMAMDLDDVNIYGAHLEGPYLSPKHCGALDPKTMRAAKKEEYGELIQKYKGIIKRWTYAPEAEGSVEFVKYINENGIVASMGHSDCTYEDAKKCFDSGSRLITHFYSTMSTVTRHNGFRKLGLIESGLLLDGLDVEIITDCCHLPPELIKMIYKIKGAEQTALVTDAMRGAGMADGESLLGSAKCGMPCIIEDGVAKLPDRSAFAGSVATADRLVRCCVQKADIPLEYAVKMMTETPAKIMNIKNKGSLKEGYDADIVIFDDDIQIKEVYVKGKKRF